MEEETYAVGKAALRKMLIEQRKHLAPVLAEDRPALVKLGGKVRAAKGRTTAN